MISEAYINQTVKEIFDEIEFPAAPAGLYDPLRYMISIGGKHIRPKLCILAYSIFKDDLYDEIIEPALALEVFHSFTLLHDDIMDRSPLRRGMPTVWKKWNEDTAILSGDVMNIDSYRRMSKAPAKVHDKVMELFIKTSTEVCVGQQFDMEFEDVPQVSMADYMKMIGLKTAVLLACSAKMGALIAGAPAAQADALYDYGYNLGLAFQVADDADFTVNVRTLYTVPSADITGKVYSVVLDAPVHFFVQGFNFVLRLLDLQPQSCFLAL